MNDDPKLTVSLPFSDSGCPLFEPEDGAELNLILAFRDAPSEIGREAMQHVILQGNRKGLRALAVAALALSESNDPEHHIHIDEEVFSDVYQNSDGLSITLEIVEN